MSSTRNFINIQNKYDRVVLLVDMDCFFCQVEVKEQPSYKDLPLAVVQYNAWRGGGIIAVNYPARAAGVTRHMRGDEAKALCPDIILCQVPSIREKADTGKYREAGKEVANVLQRFTQILERASVDEAYLDITETVNKRMSELTNGSFSLQPHGLESTHVVGFENIGAYINKITHFLADPHVNDDSLLVSHEENDLPAVRQSDIRLLIGASIAGEVRAAVKSETGYECSAGIAHNKILAKLAAGINKPNKQTILPLSEIPGLFRTLPVGKIKGLGGKFGEDVCERMGIKFLGQLLKYTETDLQRKFDEKNGSWLYYISRGIDLEMVTPRFYSKSIGCCKKFPGRNNITGVKTLQHWLNELASEIIERLEKDIMENNRKAKQMVVSYIQEIDGVEISSSRSCPFNSYNQEMLGKQALELIKTNSKPFFRPSSDAVLNNAIKFLGISVGKFETITQAQSRLQDMFAHQMAKKQKVPMEISVPAEEKNPQNDTEVEQQIVNHSEKKSAVQTKLQDIFANQVVKNQKILSEHSVENPAEHKQQAVDDFEKQKTLPEDKKSYLEEYKNKLNTMLEAEKTNPKPCTSDSKPAGFFAQFLQKQNKSMDGTQKQEKNEIVDSAELQVQELATQLDEIDSLNMQPSTSKRKFSSIDPDVEQSTADYKTEYAEYTIPKLNMELLPMVKCFQCGVQIPNDEIALQTHQDHHFAMELSRKQRAEHREALELRTNEQDTSKSTSNKSLSSSKKQKKDTLNQKKGDSNTVKPSISASSIKKFLAPKLLPPKASDEPMELCSECKTYIKVADMSEHKDYHMAKQLQRQLNQLDVRTVNVPEKTKSPGEEKDTSSNKNNSLRSSGDRSIMQFFSQKN